MQKLSTVLLMLFSAAPAFATPYYVYEGVALAEPAPTPAADDAAAYANYDPAMVPLDLENVDYGSDANSGDTDMPLDAD